MRQLGGRFPHSPRRGSLRSQVRILDLDLDFFVHGAEHFRSSRDTRLDAEDYPPWSMAEALRFLEESCGLKSKLPGIVVEHHAELFARWREGIEAGWLTQPFEVVHVDGHADLGLGDSG
jgi:hypothetical protein